MLTIFTIPKAFHGLNGVIQDNAIRSWLALEPAPEIILLGRDDGVAETAAKFGLKHAADVDCNEHGTPLVSSMFEIAQGIAGNPLMCYINADIILLNDFLPAIRRIAMPTFLVIGRRWDMDITEPLDFSEASWEKRLRARLAEEGGLHGATGLDYFVFPRGFYRDIPPFAVGRTTWDNWLAYHARRQKAPLIDATGAITIIHQNHDYSHSPAGETGVWKGPEAQVNFALAGDGKYAFSIANATHLMTPLGIRAARTPRYLYTRLTELPVLHPGLGFLYRPLKALSGMPARIRGNG